MVLSHADQFSLPAGPSPAGITRAMVDDPSTALDTPPAGAPFRELNADAVRVVATCQVTRVVPAQGEPCRWLQYVQTVLLTFDELSRPCATVLSLVSPVWAARSTGWRD